MMRDPKYYPEPLIFNPERFIGADGGINPSVLDPVNIAFGFGRRYVYVCPPLERQLDL